MAKRIRRNWTVLVTGHKLEGTARRSVLEISGVECPYLYYRAAPNRSGERLALPLLEGYLLVRSSAELLPQIRSCKGVASILGSAQNHEVDHLLCLVQSDGYVHLASEDPPAFSLGDAVRATGSAFSSQLGEYVGDEVGSSRRGNVLYRLMKREIVVAMDRYQLRFEGRWSGEH